MPKELEDCLHIILAKAMLYKRDISFTYLNKEDVEEKIFFIPSHTQHFPHVISHLEHPYGSETSSLLHLVSAFQSFVALDLTFYSTDIL